VALDLLFSRCRDHLDRVHDADDPDTAAVVTWTSRNVAGAAALLRHGLTPLSGVSIRTTRRLSQPEMPGRKPAAAHVQIRRADGADVDDVTRLLGTVRVGAHFGSVTERPDTRQALRAAAISGLADPQPWVWLSERDGAQAGMVWVEPPEAAAYIAR
jgi:hypothetical protein